jgi:hypothetical protein
MGLERLLYGYGMMDKEKPKYSADPYFDLPPIITEDARKYAMACPYCHEYLTFKLDAEHYWLYKCDTAWCPNQAGFNLRMFFTFKHEPERLYTGYSGY